VALTLVEHVEEARLITIFLLFLENLERLKDPLCQRLRRWRHNILVGGLLAAVCGPVYMIWSPTATPPQTHKKQEVP